MKVINELKLKYKIEEFESYTGGLINYNKEENPWGYKFTWNPMNVILSGSDNAYFIENYEKVFVPYNKLFKSTKNITIPNVGHYEGYPNRDSLKYKDLYGLENIKTLRRGTLRNKSYCSSWHVFVELGLTNNSLVINDVNDMTHFEFFSMNYKIKNSSSFLRSDTGDTMSGVLTMTSRLHIIGQNSIWLASNNTAKINLDARSNGDGARLHKWNRNKCL